MTEARSIATPYLGGAAVGAVLGALLVLLRIPAPAAPAADPGSAAPSICDREPEPLEPLRDETARAELHARVLRGQIALIGGIPEPWPDGTDVEAEQARLRAALQAVLDEHGYAGAVPVDVRVDCAEDPCLAQILGGPAEDPVAVRMTLDQRHALEAAAGTTGWLGSEKTFDDEPGSWFVLTFRPNAKDPARRERIRVRAERLHREVRP